MFEGARRQRDCGATEALRDYRRRVQLIFQDPYETLNPKQTIHDFVAEPLVVNAIGTADEREAKVLAALESAGLRPAADFAFRYPHELSGGQRQRVVIAGALVMDPELIVADEPVSMLDVSIRTELLRLMLDLRRERGLTYLFITHDLSLAWVIADRIAVMYLGKIMEIGPAEAVIRSPRNPYTQALVSVSPSPDPPDAGHARPADDPRRRDARRGAHPDRLPVPPALPGGVRPLQGRGAAAVRRRRRAGGRVLAGRGRPALPVVAVPRPPRATDADRCRRPRPLAGSDRAGPVSPATTRPSEPAALAPMRDRRPAGRLGGDGRRRARRPRRRGRLAAGAGRVERERVRRPPHRGRAARVRRPDPADPRGATGPDIPADLEALGSAGRRRGAARSPARRRRAGGRVRRRSGPTASTLVRGLRPADLERVGMHPDVGPLRVDELLGEWVHHDRNHIRQMLAVTQARVWAQMGNARRFSLEDL